MKMHVKKIIKLESICFHGMSITYPCIKLFKLDSTIAYRLVTGTKSLSNIATAVTCPQNFA